MVTAQRTNRNADGSIAFDYKGLSTDTKPSNVKENSLFLELDTGDFYYYHDDNWQKVGGGE